MLQHVQPLGSFPFHAEQYRDNSNNHPRPDLWRHSIHYYHPHLFAYPAFIPPLQPSGYVAHQSSISLCFMHPYHVVQGARPYPIDWVHAPIFFSSDFAPVFLPLVYTPIISLSLRTYVLLPWLMHWCSFLWVYVPISFCLGLRIRAFFGLRTRIVSSVFYVHPHICMSLFLYSPIWLGIPIPWDYGTSWTLQVFSTPTISIGSMLYLMCYLPFHALVIRILSSCQARNSYTTPLSFLLASLPALSLYNLYNLLISRFRLLSWLWGWKILVIGVC